MLKIQHAMHEMVIPEKIHTPPPPPQRKFPALGGGGGNFFLMIVSVLRYLKGGGGGLISSVGEVWMFSGMDQFYDIQ
jgi:hypothetical protein